eukprot:14089116-Ditylum_brightwellii.AAC.1
MSTVWKKIGHTDNKHEMGSISLFQVPITWLEAQSDASGITLLDNPKGAMHWKTVELLKYIVFI